MRPAIFSVLHVPDIRAKATVFGSGGGSAADGVAKKVIAMKVAASFIFRDWGPNRSSSTLLISSVRDSSRGEDVV
jgi:hypothetical protein